MALDHFRVAIHLNPIDVLESLEAVRCTVSVRVVMIPWDHMELDPFERHVPERVYGEIIYVGREDRPLVEKIPQEDDFTDVVLLRVIRHLFDDEVGRIKSGVYRTRAVRHPTGSVGEVVRVVV